MPFSNRPYEVDGNQGQQHRRLFRGPLEFKRSPRRDNGNGHSNGNNGHNNTRSNKSAPPEQTNAENFYYLKQMGSRTPMVIVMNDGEEIRGWIEWYDRTCLKVNREGAPNLLIQKHWIKYLFKEEELSR